MKTVIQKLGYVAPTNLKWLVSETADLHGSKLLRIKQFVSGIVCCCLQICCLAAEESRLGDASPATAVPGGMALQNEHSIWRTGVGEGFQAGTQKLNVSLAGGVGVAAFGSVQRHDLAWASISYGRMMGAVQGENCWYQGNWELMGELIGGSQFSPTADWIAGLSPHLRYHFATGTRLIPFVDVGAGVTGTGIHLPDLSTRFEFNTQAGLGVQWFFKDDVALTFESRYVHISNAGISEPNHGVNTVMGVVGVSWFY